MATSDDTQGEGSTSRNTPVADNNEAVLPPVYITIGPPCAGKTTLLKKLQDLSEKDILDVALDDQPNVYISVPTSFYVQENGQSNEKLWNSTIQNKTVSNRILGGEDEMRAVLQRLGGVLTKETFEERIQQIYKDQLQQRQAQQQQYASPAKKSTATIVNATSSSNTTHRQVPQQQDSETTNRTSVSSSEQRNKTKTTAAPVPNETSNATTTTNATDTPALSRHALQLQEKLQQQRLDSNMVARELIQAVEEVLQQPEQVSLPDLVDLFVVESLFRPLEGMTGVERAQELFQNASLNNHTAIAWGNTNTKPRDYRVALDIACQSKRPVHFLVYNCLKEDCMDLEANEQHVLAHQPLSVLLLRNLNRLLEKGKYIPAQTIFDSSQRIENLMQSALLELERPYKQQQLKEKQEEKQRKQEEETEKEVIVDIKDVKVQKDERNANRKEGASEVPQDKQNTSESSPLQDDDDDSRIAPPKFSKFDLDRVLCQMVQYKLEPNRTVTPITDGRDGRKRQRQASSGGRGRNITRGRFSNSGRSTWQQPQGRRPYGTSRHYGNADGQQPQQQPQRNRGDRQYSQQTRCQQQQQPSSWHYGRNQRNAGEYQRQQDVPYDTQHGNRITGYGRDSGNYRGGGYHRQDRRYSSRGGNRNARAASGRGGGGGYSSRNRQEEYGSGRGGGRWQGGGGYNNPRDDNNRTNMDRGSWQQEQQQDGRES